MLKLAFEYFRVPGETRPREREEGEGAAAAGDFASILIILSEWKKVGN